MNVLARLRDLPEDRDWLRLILSIVGIIGIGVLAGYQYMMPDKRVLGVAAAVVLFGVAWRLDLVSGIGILVLAVPFPRNTSFGSSTLAFILLLMVVWLLRYSQRDAAAPRRTP